MSTPQQRVPDEIVAAFRAYLSGDKERWTARNAALDRSKPGRRAYKAFLIAMFVTAVGRRFGRGPRWSHIVEFVADLRSRDDELADMLDPEETERMIERAGEGTVHLDDAGKRSVEIWMAVLTAIIRDESLAPAELDVFLERARTYAEGVLG